MSQRQSARRAYWQSAIRTFLRHHIYGSQIGSIPRSCIFWLAVQLIIIVSFLVLPPKLLWLGSAITVSMATMALHLANLQRLQKLKVNLRATPYWRLRWYYIARVLLVTPLFGVAIFYPIFMFIYAPLYLGLRKMVEAPNTKRRTVLILRRFGEDSTDTFGHFVFPIAYNFGQCITLTEKELKSRWARLAAQWSPLRYVVVDDSQWQNNVVKYLKIADVVILDYRNRSRALEWEYQQALEHAAHKLLVITSKSDHVDELIEQHSPNILYFQDKNPIEFQSSLGEAMSNIIMKALNTAS
jgi:hypothetical protein